MDLDEATPTSPIPLRPVRARVARRGYAQPSFDPIPRAFESGEQPLADRLWRSFHVAQRARHVLERPGHILGAALHPDLRQFETA